MKCKPHYDQTGELLWRDTGRIHWRMLARRSVSILAGYLADPQPRDTQRDTRRDPLTSYSGILSRILGGIHWRAVLSGILGGIHWRATLGYSAGHSSGSTAGLLVGYSAGSTEEPLWRDTRRDPLASSSGGILGGIHWPAALAGYSAGLGGIHWREAGYSAGSTGEQLWRDTGRDHWRAALAGYSAGSTGELLWRDTRRDPLANCPDGILGGVVWKHRKSGFQHKI